MEKVYKVETTLSHSLAELYAGLEEEFANKSSIPLSDMNRTLLQTGLIHHLTMMSGLGLIEPRESRAAAQVDRPSSEGYHTLGHIADGADLLAGLRF